MPGRPLRSARPTARRGFHCQLVALPDKDVIAEDEEDAGGLSGFVAADGGQLNGERRDVAVCGRVIGGRGDVLAAPHELLVGLGDSGIELLVSPELYALHELDSVQRPKTGNGLAPRFGVEFAPHRQIAADDLRIDPARPLLGGGRTLDPMLTYLSIGDFSRAIRRPAERMSARGI